MKKTVTKCVCQHISFEEIWDYAQKQRLELEDLISESICCCGCRICRPNVEKMMKTGQTAFVPGDYYITEDS